MGNRRLRKVAFCRVAAKFPNNNSVLLTHGKDAVDALNKDSNGYCRSCDKVGGGCHPNSDPKKKYPVKVMDAADFVLVKPARRRLRYVSSQERIIRFARTLDESQNLL